MVLSYGARTLETIIRASRVRKGGRRECGRPYLARRMGCSVRTVSKYVKELRDAGRLDVVPPKRVKRAQGWRCEGVNSYRLLDRANPAPHVTGPARLPRSRRGAASRTPHPYGCRGAGPSGVPATPDGPRQDPAEAAAALLALLAARDEQRKQAAA